MENAKLPKTRKRYNTRGRNDVWLILEAFLTCEFYLSPVHTNPFSNENGAVLLRFQKDLRPH